MRCFHERFLAANLFDLAAGAVQARESKSEWESQTIGCVHSLAGPSDAVQVLDISSRQW
jgi:hypothetical protein